MLLGLIYSNETIVRAFLFSHILTFAYENFLRSTKLRDLATHKTIYDLPHDTNIFTKYNHKSFFITILGFDEEKSILHIVINAQECSIRAYVSPYV